MPSPKAQEILRRAYLQGYEAGRRDGQRDARAEKRQTVRRTTVAEAIERRLDGGPQPAEAMLALAGELHVGERTIYRAKAELGILSVQVRRGVWMWATADQATALGKSGCQPVNQLAFAA